MHRAGVAEWQTRRTQNPLVARPCGFDSLLRHTFFFNVYAGSRRRYFSRHLHVTEKTRLPCFADSIF
jgi:hypothetical protein